jgi:hypothetical protein
MLATIRRNGARLASLGALLIASACGGGGSDTPGGPTTPGGGGATPVVTVALGASTASITQGATTNVTVTVSRAGGFAGEVTVSATGLPAGVTAPSITIASAATSGTLVLTATSSAAAGSATVVITASGTGVTTVTASLSLTIVAASGGGGSTGAFTMALSTGTATLAQGASSAAITITITRTGGFTGAVALTVTGAPAGLTPTLSASSVTGTTATLTLAAGAGLAPGAYPLTVRGTGTGVTDQSVALAATVTASGGGGGGGTTTGNVTWPFCGSFGLPIWVAFQDGTGAWTRAISSTDSYSFQISAGKGGVAWVLQRGANDFALDMFFGSTAELQARGAELCQGTTGPAKTVNGTVTGTAATDIILLSLGRAAGSVAPASSTSFSLTNVGQGTLDLIAGRSAMTIAGTSVSFALNKLILRRGLTPATGSTLPVLDFGAAEAVTPASNSITMSNLGADGTIIAGAYQTANRTFGAYYADATASTATTRTWSGIPAASQVAGDLHLLTISAQATGLTAPTSTRAVTLAFATAANKTITFGPTMTLPTITTLASAPYARLRAALTLQAEYGRYFTANFQQAGSTPRRTEIQMSSSYGVSGTFNIDIPDFTGVAGFDPAWGLRAGTVVNWTMAVSGWEGTAGTVGGPIVEGGIFSSATRLGSITP